MTPPIFPRITPLHRPSWTHQSCGSKDWVITKVTVTSRLTTSRRGKIIFNKWDVWIHGDLLTLLYTGCYSLLNIRLQLHGQWYAKCGYAKSDCTPKTWYKTRSLLLGFVWFTTMYTLNPGWPSFGQKVTLRNVPKHQCLKQSPMFKTQPFVFWGFLHISQVKRKTHQTPPLPNQNQLFTPFHLYCFTTRRPGWSTESDLPSNLFSEVFSYVFSSPARSKIMSSPPWIKFFLNFHWRSGYPSIPRASLAAARRTDWTLIRLRHNTDLCACLMLVIRETLDGFPMKSSSCWHAVAMGLKTHGDRSACLAKSCAVWHSMWSFG